MITIAAAVAGIAAVVAVASVLVGMLSMPKHPIPAATAATGMQSAPSASAVATPDAVPAVSAQASAVPTASPAVPAPAAAQSAVSGVVVIDPGHQAEGDSSLEPEGPGSSTKKPKVADGAEGVVTHTPESQVNLEIALRLRKALEDRGVKVKMVRTSQKVNIANSQRAAIANDINAALFIRLHCDGSDNSSAYGLATLIPASNRWTKEIVPESKKAAGYVHRAVISATGASDRGIVSRGDLSGFNWSKVPTILPEMGFLSNPAEDRKLNSDEYQVKLANGMADGIVRYLESR